MNRLLRESQPSYTDEWEFELPVSMIDVVFLLLIFFMCATRFRSVDDCILRNEMLGANRPDPVREIERPVEICVRIFWEDASGEVVADPCPGGRVVTTVEGRRCADPDELTCTLSSLSRRHRRMPVVIDARKRVPFSSVVGAMDACNRAGIADVRFRAPARTDLGSQWWHL